MIVCLREKETIS